MMGTDSLTDAGDDNNPSAEDRDGGVKKDVKTATRNMDTIMIAVNIKHLRFHWEHCICHIFSHTLQFL